MPSWKYFCPLAKMICVRHRSYGPYTPFKDHLVLARSFTFLLPSELTGRVVPGWQVWPDLFGNFLKQEALDMDPK